MGTTNQQILDKLVTARIALLLKHPFFGNLATRLKLVKITDYSNITGAKRRGEYVGEYVVFFGGEGFFLHIRDMISYL